MRRQFERALITGATSGIGKALVSLFPGEIIAVGRDEEKLKLLGVKKYVVADMAVSSEPIIASIWRDKPDLVINNAGFGLYGDTTFLPLQEQKNILEVNCTALFEITQQAACMMIQEKKEGVILNVSSMAGEMPTPLMSVYGASKAFVTQFSKAMDFECRKKGVRVLVSLPGKVATPFSQKAAKKKNLSQDNKIPVVKMAKRILWQIDKRKKVDIYDFRYKLLHFLSQYILPENLVSAIISASIKKVVASSNQDIHRP